MTISRICKTTAISASLLVVLSACSSTEDDNLGLEDSSASPPPAAPELAEESLEEFSVDQKQADKLKEAGKEVANSWFLDQLKEADIDLDSSLAFIIRHEVCDDIYDGGNLHTISNKTLGDYELTGKQRGVMISASLLSYCPEEKLAIPSGSLDEYHNPGASSDIPHPEIAPELDPEQDPLLLDQMDQMR